MKKLVIGAAAVVVVVVAAYGALVWSQSSQFDEAVSGPNLRVEAHDYPLQVTIEKRSFFSRSLKVALLTHVGGEPLLYFGGPLTFGLQPHLELQALPDGVNKDLAALFAAAKPQFQADFSWAMQPAKLTFSSEQGSVKDDSSQLDFGASHIDFHFAADGVSWQGHMGMIKVSDHETDPVELEVGPQTLSGNVSKDLSQGLSFVSTMQYYRIRDAGDTGEQTTKLVLRQKGDHWKQELQGSYRDVNVPLYDVKKGTLNYDTTFVWSSRTNPYLLLASYWLGDDACPWSGYCTAKNQVDRKAQRQGLDDFLADWKQGKVYAQINQLAVDSNLLTASMTGLARTQGDTQPVSLGKANVVVTKTTVPFLVQLLAGCAQSGTCTKDANGSYNSELTVQMNQGRYVISGNGKTIAAW